jgi:hypothetical protein
MKVNTKLDMKLNTTIYIIAVGFKGIINVLSSTTPQKQPPLRTSPVPKQCMKNRKSISPTRNATLLPDYMALF